MVEEIRGCTIRFIFGHVGLRIEYIDFFLFCVHGAKSNRTLPSGVISQYISIHLEGLMLNSPQMVRKKHTPNLLYRSENSHMLSTGQNQYNDAISFYRHFFGYTTFK